MRRFPHCDVTGSWSIRSDVGFGLVVSAGAVVPSFTLGEIWKPQHSPARIVTAPRIRNYAPVRTLGRERVSSCESIHRAATKLEPDELAVRAARP